MKFSFRLSDGRRPHRSIEESGIAERPPAAASGGADFLTTPSSGGGRKLGDRDVLDAGEAVRQSDVRER
jgi:hypothetical protein